MATEEKLAELTEKQKIFCREYIFDWNATRAAIAAGYSESTAKQMGYENLTKPYIKAYIEEIQQNLAEVAGISRLMVIREHQKLAFSSIAHMHNEWVERKDFDKLTDDQKACIQEISTKVITRNAGTEDEPEIEDIEFVKIKLYDKQKSLDSISKMLGYNEAESLNINHVGLNNLKLPEFMRPKD